MRKNKLLITLFIGLIIVYLFGLTAFSANPDIVVMEYGQSVKHISSKEPFTFTINYKRFTDSEICNLFLSIDESSSFYLSQNQPQIVALENIVDDRPITAIMNLVYKGKGSELVLVLSYTKDGELYEFKHTVYLNVKEIEENKPDTPPVNTNTQVPNIRIIGETTIPEAYAGESITIELPIKNVSDYKAINVSATISFDSNMLMLSGKKLNESMFFESISYNKTKKMQFEIYIDPYTEPGNYKVILDFDYTNLSGDAFKSSDNFYIRVENNNTNPILVFKDYITNPEIPQRGDTLKSILKFENMGTLDAKNVKITLKGFKEYGIIPKSTNMGYIQSINGKSVGEVQFTFEVSKDIKTRMYPIEGTIEYMDSHKKPYSSEFVYYIETNIPDSEEANIDVKNVVLSANKINAGNENKLTFDLENSGNYVATNIKVSLSTDDEIINKSLKIITVDSIESGQKKSLEFVLGVSKKAISKNYPIGINIEYEKDVEGNKRLIERYVGIVVENTIINQSIPKVIINGYTLSSSDVSGSETFDLNLNIMNTNKIQNVSNIKAKLVGEQGILLVGKENSNTFFIEEIEAGTVFTKKLSFITERNVSTKTYLMDIEFEYQDDEGNSYTSKDTINIPITHKSILKVNDVKISTSIDNSIAVSVDFYNIGKTNINNLFVKCKGDFEIDGTDYFVGSFEPGKSDFYEVLLTPIKESVTNGKIIFTFQDETGQEIEIEKAFDIDAQIAKMEMDQEVMHKQEMSNSSIENSYSEESFLVLLSLPLVATIIITTFLWLSKKKKKEINDLDDYT